MKIIKFKEFVFDIKGIQIQKEDLNLKVFLDQIGKPNSKILEWWRKTISFSYYGTMHYILDKEHTLSFEPTLNAAVLNQFDKFGIRGFNYVDNKTEKLLNYFKDNQDVAEKIKPICKEIGQIQVSWEKDGEVYLEKYRAALSQNWHKVIPKEFGNNWPNHPGNMYARYEILRRWNPEKKSWNMFLYCPTCGPDYEKHGIREE